MKYISILSFSILISVCSCTKTENKPVEQKLSQKVKADTVITYTGIFMLEPDEEEIGELKKKQGEDNFYTIADDANYYSAEIFEAAPATIYTGHKILDFPKENFVFDKNKSENKWLVIDYIEGSQPKIYSLVDYYQHITKK